MNPQDSLSPEVVSQARSRAWKRFYWVATVWLIGYLGIIAKQAVSLESPLEGIKEGAIMGAVFSPFMLLTTLPLGWLGIWIASRKSLQRHKLWMSLLLPVLFSFAGAVDAAVDRIRPHKRFERATGAQLPRDARMERCFFEGTSGIADATYYFEFTCSPEETGRLIRELDLQQDHSPAGGTRAKAWKVEERWNRVDLDTRGADYVELETNASRTRVLVIAGWI